MKPETADQDRMGKLFSGNKSGLEMGRALDTLAENQKARVEVRDEAPGRPPEVWFAIFRACFVQFRLFRTRLCGRHEKFRFSRLFRVWQWASERLSLRFTSFFRTTLTNAETSAIRFAHGKLNELDEYSPGATLLLNETNE